MTVNRYFVCEYSEVPSDEFKIKSINGKSIGFIKVDGEIHAILNYCPHQGAEICKGSVSGTTIQSDVGTYEYGLEDRVIRCPWHGWEFELKTGEGIYPGKEKVAKFETEVNNQNVYVYI